MTCPSRKVAYRTHRAALLALESIRQRREVNPNRTERAPYRCLGCGEWHLTSQPQRTVPRRHARSKLAAAN